MLQQMTVFVKHKFCHKLIGLKLIEIISCVACEREAKMRFEMLEKQRHLVKQVDLLRYRESCVHL